MAPYDPQRPSGRRLRFTERVLEVGQEIYVFGEARIDENVEEATDANPDHLEITRDESSDKYIIAPDVEEREFAANLKSKGRWEIVGGILWASVGLSLVLRFGVV